jgi:hypothetical protein
MVGVLRVSCGSVLKGVLEEAQGDGGSVVATREVVRPSACNANGDANGDGAVSERRHLR